MDNFNTVTNAIYSANNQQHLEEHKEAYDLESDAWAGFKQWKEKGRKVKKGAKGCKIFMVCEKKKDDKNSDDKTGEDKKKKVLKALYVFNEDHTETI